MCFLMLSFFVGLRKIARLPSSGQPVTPDESYYTLLRGGEGNAIRKLQALRITLLATGWPPKEAPTKGTITLWANDKQLTLYI